MFLAIYGRKSIYSDHSDSIDNQFRMCRECIDFKFPGENSIETYSDEAYTGANTDRPDLQRLLADVKAGLVDALVVYQLDRLSRDVRDFSNIYSLLEEHHVMFISIKENIDTTHADRQGHDVCYSGFCPDGAGDHRSQGHRQYAGPGEKGILDWREPARGICPQKNHCQRQKPCNH